MNDMYRSTDGGATWTLVFSNSGWSQSLTGQRSVVATDGSVVMTGGSVYGSPDWEYLNEVWWYALATPTSNCVITHAIPGDVYNIGGVSSEPTTHIEFTMWKNSAYGKGK